MALGTGLDTQMGLKAESTYGTAVTVDRFNYINSETIKADVGKIESPHLGTIVRKTTQVKTYISGAGGDIAQPFMNKGMGVILNQSFGTSVVAQVGATAEWTATHTLDLTNGKRGKSATVQIGRASVDGTVRPFTYEGGKIVGFTIALDEMGLLVLTTTWVFEDQATGTALATASYATNLEMFDWSDATVTLGGVTVFVRNFSLAVAFNMNTERRGLSQTLRKEPIINGFVDITGDMAGEFEDLTHYNAFIAGTQQALVFTVTGSTIPTAANPYKVVITVPNVELTGDTPNVSGPELLVMPRTFRALQSAATAPLTLVQHSDDVAL